MNSKRLIIVTFVIFLIFVITNNTHLRKSMNVNKQINHSSDISNTVTIECENILSLKDMSVIIGGCSGECLDNEHSCPSDCSHLDADNCQGSTGSCVNDNWSVLCDCPTYYDFDEGC